MLRQCSTFHPEFAFLPRKFKIAVSAAKEDRALIRAHDVGLEVVRDESSQFGLKVFVGGGLGRTPVIGKLLREFLPRRHLLSYLDAILRVYAPDVFNAIERQSADQLAMNDIAQVSFKLAQPIFADAYADYRATGAFIVIDESTNNTVGAGMIV